MLFKTLRAGDEVILATSQGRGGTFSHAVAVVESVTSSLVVVDGFKFNRKDGRGRTTPHHILPNTAEHRREHLGNDEPDEPAETDPDAQLRSQARDALRIIRAEPAANDDDLIELLGAEALAAFRRRYRDIKGSG